MAEAKSLSDIRPGDKVTMRYSVTSTFDQIATVDRITKTQIIIGRRRFRISDGRELGCDRWVSFRITPATPEELAELERRRQIEQDQRRAYELANEVGTRVRACSNAAAAIPHLEAALAALAGGRALESLPN